MSRFLSIELKQQYNKRHATQQRKQIWKSRKWSVYCLALAQSNSIKWNFMWMFQTLEQWIELSNVYEYKSKRRQDWFGYFNYTEENFWFFEFGIQKLKTKSRQINRIFVKNLSAFRTKRFKMEKTIIFLRNEFNWTDE